METFQITEVLDKKTFPICRRMHGKTFKVDRPLARIEQKSTTSDPTEMKAAYPFPKASKVGLRELENLSSGDLAGRGCDTPPIHPSCRGVPQRTGAMSTFNEATRRACTHVTSLISNRKLRPVPFRCRLDRRVLAVRLTGVETRGGRARRDPSSVRITSGRVLPSARRFARPTWRPRGRRAVPSCHAGSASRRFR